MTAKADFSDKTAEKRPYFTFRLVKRCPEITSRTPDSGGRHQIPEVGQIPDNDDDG